MHVPRSRLALAALAFVLLPALVGASARAQTTPSLVTDAPNYLPGETAILMGSGFLPGETVDVSIAIDDDANNVHIGDYDWMVELANDSGDFTTFWTVPLEAFGMTLRATALGLTSGSVATITFFDDTGTHFVNYKIVGMEALVPPATFSIQGLYPGVPGAPYVSVLTDGTISSSIACTPLTGNVFFLENASYSVNGVGTWTYNTSTPPNNFVPGSSNATTTVNMYYNAFLCIFNNPPTLTASDYSFLVCAEDGAVTLTVTPADFNPQFSDPDGDLDATIPRGSFGFWDGMLPLKDSVALTFTPGVSSHTLVLRVTDDPSWRPQTGPSHCAPLQPRSTDVVVTVTASVYPQHAPTVTANDLNVGAVCGSTVTIPVTAASFSASVSDPGENDEPYTVSLNKSQVTLTLPEGVSDAVVSDSVVISATDDPSGRDHGACAPLQPMTGSTIVHVTAHLFRNSAPIISASNADLGNIVGCLSSGSLITTAAVSPATFGASAMDPDGDPVTISADVSNVTLVGPGVASATVVLTATDDPTARTGGVCSTPQSSSVSVQVTARIVYRFEGVLSPLSNCVSTKVKRGSNVPVKFRLYDCNNIQITTGSHTIAVDFNQCNAPDGEVDIDEPGCGDDGNINFHYTGGLWLFNLKTNSSYNLNTTYIIRITTDDGVVHNAMISIKR